MLHIVLKFQFDCAYFQGGETSANFGGKVELEKRKKIQDRLERP